jgi:hypothetical protein
MAGHIAPWQITVQAAVGLNTLPEQLPITAATNEFKVYFDPPERRLETRPDGGMDSIAVYRGYLMPFAAGELTAPALDLPYFDAARGTVAHVTLPGQTLQVAAGAPAAEEAAPVPPVAAPSTPARPGAETTSAVPALVWQIASAVLLILWLVTLGLWRRQAARRGNRPAKAGPVSAAGHPLQQRLLAAPGGTRTLEEGLRDWEHRNGSDEEVRAAVRAVQRLCYRPGDDDAEGNARQVVERAIRRMRGRRPAEHAVADGWSPQAFRPAGRRARGAGPPS